MKISISLFFFLHSLSQASNAQVPPYYAVVNRPKKNFYKTYIYGLSFYFLLLDTLAVEFTYIVCMHISCPIRPANLTGPILIRTGKPEVLVTFSHLKMHNGRDKVVCLHCDRKPLENFDPFRKLSKQNCSKSNSNLCGLSAGI